MSILMRAYFVAFEEPPPMPLVLSSNTFSLKSLVSLDDSYGNLTCSLVKNAVTYGNNLKVVLFIVGSMSA